MFFKKPNPADMELSYEYASEEDSFEAIFPTEPIQRPTPHGDMYMAGKDGVGFIVRVSRTELLPVNTAEDADSLDWMLGAQRNELQKQLEVKEHVADKVLFSNNENTFMEYPCLDMMYFQEGLYNVEKSIYADETNYVIRVGYKNQEVAESMFAKFIQHLNITEES